MDYHPEDFLALSNAVEEEGGLLLADPCEGELFPIRLPDPSREGRRRLTKLRTTRCGMSARMELPYDPTQHVRIMDDEEADLVIVDHPGEPQQFKEQKLYTGQTGKVPVEHTVTVCAVDDAVGLWPRFAGVVSERSQQR